ncbi:MAG: S8 family serine peptidase [Cyanobacteria bacterium]|nr:S8 family serine peptidase [Cyanobacteriota bacterium]MDW8202375.1 S8 family serine peptidase [Cyanobacteriota bacterium SKYGB_h_bin112]
MYSSQNRSLIALITIAGLGTVNAIWLPLATANSSIRRSSSIGEAGINALVLHQEPYNLRGRKIAIGQVEIGRPGRFGVDKTTAPRQNRSVSVERVFFRDAPPKVGANLDSHAQNVASIMISNSKEAPGVAPAARLYASAVGTLRRSGQPEECLASQHVALQNGGDVRAINFSFGESLREDPREGALLDGNALLTQCVDWSSRVHNVLYVVAGNQGKGGIPIPTDNYNGINVAYTTRVNGVFSRVDIANLGDPAAGIPDRIIGREANLGARRAIGLLAPGNAITVINPDGRLTETSGTSFATPHVTATVALLQEFGDRQLSKRQPNWTVDARRHEVMKAVLLNAADKLMDAGNGLALGMQRTVVDRSGRTWLESDAYRDPNIPLNIQMGTGHLNAFRAYQQFSAGQWQSDSLAPAIGWDYSVVSAANTATEPQFRDYVLKQPLQKGSYISVTLAWNRQVDLIDTNGNQQYDLGESFRDRGLNNLNLYLMRIDDTSNSQAIWASTSDVDSVEHLFYQIPATGRYKIRVQYQTQVNDATQPYGIAWWSVPSQ